MYVNLQIYGWSAFMWAVEEGIVAMMKLLCSKGADIDIHDQVTIIQEQ